MFLEDVQWGDAMARAREQRPRKLLEGDDARAGTARREQAKYRAKVFRGREHGLETSNLESMGGAMS